MTYFTLLPLSLIHPMIKLGLFGLFLTLLLPYLNMSMFRNTVWFFKGMREYTKSGFEAAAAKFNPEELKADISGKSFLITGANSGIGKETALELAKLGGTVHIVCRNLERGEAAKSEILTTVSSASVHVHQLDISDPKAIHAFVKAFASQGHQLHCLVNNAGCMVNTREVTEDGFEVNFATNSLGTYILTTELIPTLRHHANNTDDATNGATDGTSQATLPRVITVSSGGMLTQKLDISDLMSEKMTPFDGTKVYAQQKRQQIVMTETWAKEHPDIHFSVMHPGWADTPAVRSAMPGFYEKMKDKLRTPGQGCDTVVWLAGSQSAAQQPSGLFFQDRVAVSTHLPLAWSKSDAGVEQQLMEKIAEMAAKFKS